MMYRTLIAVCTLAVLAAFAGATQAKKTIHCAVMTGSVVNVSSATKNKMFADYKGRRYFFCCDGCPQAFKANPKKYAKGESIPTPKVR